MLFPYLHMLQESWDYLPDIAFLYDRLNLYIFFFTQMCYHDEDLFGAAKKVTEENTNNKLY